VEFPATINITHPAPGYRFVRNDRMYNSAISHGNNVFDPMGYVKNDIDPEAENRAPHKLDTFDMGMPPLEWHQLYLRAREDVIEHEIGWRPIASPTSRNQTIALASSDFRFQLSSGSVSTISMPKPPRPT
jgi:hypothetical protein